MKKKKKKTSFHLSLPPLTLAQSMLSPYPDPGDFGPGEMVSGGGSVLLSLRPKFTSLTGVCPTAKALPLCTSVSSPSPAVRT